MHRGRLFAAIVLVLATCANVAVGQLREQSPDQQPAARRNAVEPTDDTPPPATEPSQQKTKEKLARIWANEPPLVRLARDKFGAELTETDAKFFAAVAASEWADFRPSPQDDVQLRRARVLERQRHAQSRSASSGSSRDSSAVKLVPSRGMWMRGVHIQGKIDLYRCDVPFSLTFYDCLFDDGLNISHAKLQELDIRNCCSAAIQARGVQIAENVYLLTTCVFGGLDFIDAQIGGDFDFTGGLAFHGSSQDDLKKKPASPSTSTTPKSAATSSSAATFRAYGQVRLIGATNRPQLPAAAAPVRRRRPDRPSTPAAPTSPATFRSPLAFAPKVASKCAASHIGGDLDCDGGQFIAAADDDAHQRRSGRHRRPGQPGRRLPRRRRSAAHQRRHRQRRRLRQRPLPQSRPATRSASTARVIGRSLRIGDDSSRSDRQGPRPAPRLPRARHRPAVGHANQPRPPRQRRPIRSAGRHGDVSLQHESRQPRRSLRRAKSRVSQSVLGRHRARARPARQPVRRQQGASTASRIWANGMHVRGHVYCNQVDTPEQIRRVSRRRLHVVPVRHDRHALGPVRREVRSTRAAMRSTPATAASAAT